VKAQPARRREGVTVADREYQALLESALTRGVPVRTRNADVRRIFAYPVTFTRTPLVEVRTTAWRNCLREWQWFMSGSNYIGDLHPAVRHWWQPWADEDGFVAFNYSEQFRYENYGGSVDRGHVFDQIAYLVGGIREHPFSRRNAITTWNTGDMAHPDCKISNCHGTHVQAVVDPDDSLHLFTSQRSADVVCGVPHNWLQYWGFLLWLAHRTGRRAGSLVWVGVDVHLYEEHIPLAAEVLSAPPEPEPPGLVYRPTSEQFLADDFTLSRGYRPKVLTRARMVV
jgi:thymidylate synthase